LWNLPPQALNGITAAWEAQFSLLFQRLNIACTRGEVETHASGPVVHSSLEDSLRRSGVPEVVQDLAD
jgi:hypothetical protein